MSGEQEKKTTDALLRSYRPVSREWSKESTAGLTVILGIVIAIVGFVVAPNWNHIGSTYYWEIYWSLFFLLVGAGLIITGVRKLID